MHKLLWLAPLALYSLDAQARGLFTHVYFAHQWENCQHSQPISYYSPDDARICQKKGYQRKESPGINALVSPAIKAPISAPATTSVG